MPTRTRTEYIRPFPALKIFGLAAPVKVATGTDAEVGVVTAVMTAEVTFATAGVAVGPTKSDGKVTLKDRAHA